MSGKLILNLVLLALVVVLALLAVYQPGSRKEVRAATPITTLTADQIIHVEITRKTLPAIVLNRHDGHWRMEQPYAVAADSQRLSLLLDFVETKSASHFPVADGELARYGLDAPHATLRLNDLQFDFGGSNPLSLERYIRSGGSVYLALDTTYQHLITDAAAYVDPQLVDAGAQIASIAVPGLSVGQRDGKLSASAAAVSADAPARFIERWRRTRAIAVRTLAPEEQPSAGGEVAELRFGDGTARRFAIIRRGDELVLARTDLGLGWYLPAAAAEQLLTLEPAQAKP